MCGRITLTQAKLGEIAELLEADLAPDDAAGYRPRYNVAPTDRHWIVRASGDRRRLGPAHWGFVLPGKPPAINARAESVASRPAFREALERRRCVVPTDGFFEWTGSRGERRPIWFHPPNGGLLPMAGLWEERDGLATFTLLTTAANALVAPIHDRMPVVLSPEGVRAWLRAPARELLVPAPPGALVAVEVSPRVNSVANDDPACLEPAPAAPQLKLF